MAPESVWRYLRAALLALSLTPVLAGAQPQLQFSGYAVDLPVYEHVREDLAGVFRLDPDLFVNITRVRLRPTLVLWEGGRIALEHEIELLYAGSGGSPGLFPLTGTSLSRQAVHLQWTPVSDQHLTLTHFVDRLYFRQNFSNASLVIGRQRIAWGTGRVWNPTDLFSPINPASFSKIEKDGADAVSFKYYFGDFTALEVVANAEREFTTGNGAARFQTNILQYDVSILGGYFDRRFVAGGDFAGNVFDAGFRGEAIYEADTSGGTGAFVRFILGTDYQISARLYALVEYQYNGEGQADPARYDLLRLVRGGILNLNRDYLFLNATYQLHPLVVVSLGYNANLRDGSGFLAPSLSYSASANTDLGIGGLITYGKRLAEYWYYPTSIYLKGDWYF